MGHEEEDKELMLIRMETLKTMIGKLKNKNKDPGKSNTSKPAITRVSSSSKTDSPVATTQNHVVNKSLPANSNSHTSSIQTVNTTSNKPKSLSLNQNANHIVTTATSMKVVPKRTMPCTLSQYKYQLSPTKHFTTTTNVSHTSKPHCNGTANSQHNTNSTAFSFAAPSSASSLSPNTASKLLLKTVTTTSFSTKTTSSTVTHNNNTKPVKNAIECLIKHPHKTTSSQTLTKPLAPSFPATKPLATKISATKPPATKLPATKLPATKPPATKPPATKPPATKLPATKPVTRPPLTKPPEIKPGGPKLKTKTNTITNASQNSSSSGSESGKILFQRTNKVLFERRPSNQSYSKQKYRLNNSLDFSKEFTLIRNHQNNLKRPTIPTSANKFQRPPAPETCERARTILSKYKVVHGKDTPRVPPIKKVVNRDINANYSNSSASFLPLSTSSSSLAPTGKILYEKPKGVIAGSLAYSRKGRVYHPSGKVPFVSRRLSYMKSTAASNPFALKKQNLLTSRTIANANKKEIIISRHGNNFQVAGNLKSLRRVSRSNGKNLLLAHTTKTGVSPKNRTAKRYLASQLLKKTRLTARKKVEKKKEYCIFFNRYGKCKREDKCPFIHDPDKIAICTRFLRGTCKVDNCLFSHKLDPDKMPVCSYFIRGECGRDDCPYRHVNVGDSASICDDFVKGYCPKGKECAKKHILECEEFSNTGVCSSRKTCNLIHRHSDNRRKRKLSGSRPPKGFHSKTKRIASDASEELRDDEVKIDTEIKQRQAKKHMIPKFVSDNIRLLRESTSAKPTSFSDIRKFYETNKNEKEKAKNDNVVKTDNLWDNDFIPLSNYSGGESDDEDDDENDEFIRRLFTFKKKSSSN